MTKQSDKVDTVVIGSGVVGLAVALELATARPGETLVLLEQNDTFGTVTSSRNSEVIHAGIYYPANSLKARLCVEGRALIYRFCRQWAIRHNRCGKLIVANSETEVASLTDLQSRAIANGVEDLELLSDAAVKLLEPHIQAKAALLSPSTGIIDSHQLMACLEAQAVAQGVLPAYRHRVTAIEKLPAAYQISFTNPDGSNDRLLTERVVNCAGLHADRVAALAGIDPDQAGYRQKFCKGEYFSLPPAKAACLQHLVYPPPLHDLTGLGIHATKSLDGRLRLGPNAIYVSSEDYQVDPAHRTAFYDAVKAFLPFIEPADLEPEMAGIRPKLSGPGEAFRDFVIREESERNLPGLINLIGIESPGLTSALAIAREVNKLIA